jgi:hypothetical protein
MISVPTRQRRRRKPAKPYHAFPLTAHNDGQWCKKIHGKVRFFGTWAEPEAALQGYLKMAADLHAGREPNQSVPPDAPTVKEVCNHYLAYQLRRAQVGEIGPRWFEDRLTALEFCLVRRAWATPPNSCPDGFLGHRQKPVRAGLTGRKGLGVYALTRAITVVQVCSSMLIK